MVICLLLSPEARSAATPGMHAKHHTQDAVTWHRGCLHYVPATIRGEEERAAGWSHAAARIKTGRQQKSGCPLLPPSPTAPSASLSAHPLLTLAALSHPATPTASSLRAAYIPETVFVQRCSMLLYLDLEVTIHPCTCFCYWYPSDEAAKSSGSNHLALLENVFPRHPHPHPQDQDSPYCGRGVFIQGQQLECYRLGESADDSWIQQNCFSQFVPVADLGRTVQEFARAPIMELVIRLIDLVNVIPAG